MIWLTLLLVHAVHADPKFENLGQPVRTGFLSLSFVTQDAEGRHVAWGAIEGAEERAIVGIRVDTGQVIRVDLRKFGKSHIQMMKAADGNIYAYTGTPGRFLRYDVKKGALSDLGVPAQKATYWLGSAVGPDGKFYVGSYPATHLVCCDPATGKIEDMGRIAVDARESYIVHPVVSADNVVYCPVGLHHKELWAFDVKTRTKKQILPSELTKSQGAPRVWLGMDGQVYGEADGAKFLCKPDGVEMGKTAEIQRVPKDNRVGDWIVESVNEEGKLVLTHAQTRQRRLVQTEFKGVANPIYSVGCARDGKIYGGAFEPSHTFCFDTKTRELKDIGGLSSGRIQVYDILNHPKGLFLSSYMGACLDFYDPNQPRRTGQNPRHIARLSEGYMQERPVQLALGPDGMVYTGTIPVKGHLGGALVRVHPDDFSVKVWRNLIPNQSVTNLAPVPETGELFCATTISGGSSAIPTEKEAFIFLWDTKQERVVFQAQPVAGAKSYGSVVRARNGVVYGIAGGKYYAFDPKARKVVFTGDLPVKTIHFPGLSDEPVGKDGLIYGVGDDAVFAINPADHSAKIVLRHESLSHAHGFYVTPDGVLYYGSHGNLMRCKVEE